MKTALSWLLTIISITVVGLPQSGGTHDRSLLRSSDEVLEEICRIRQVEPRAPIKKGIKSKEEIRSFIVDRADEEYPAEEVAAEALLLKRLKLIPQEMDLRRFMLDLLTEQIAGFYDPRTKTFYIADWIPPEMQKPVMAHELTHALQDQQFDLEKYLSPQDEDDDKILAQSSVIEGEGLLMMLAYTIEPFGRKIDDLDIIELNRLQRPMVEAEYPTFASAPTYLKEMLLFPYTYGANFVQKFLQTRDWKSLDLLYQKFPESTEQILHPEKAMRNPDPPTELPVLEPDKLDDLVLAYDNVLGEFGLYLYLANRIGEEAAQTAAAGWDGDHVAIFLDPTQKETLTLNSVWDSDSDAAEFFDALKWAVSQLDGETAQWDSQESGNEKSLSGTLPNRHFRLGLKGRAVTLIDQDT